MSMNFKRRLPIPQEIREGMPLSAELGAEKVAFDAQVAAIIRGEDSRRCSSLGPCSADREDSVLDYATRLAKLADEVRDRLSSCRASTPTSRARRAPATRACSTTPTPTPPATSSRASRPSAACTSRVAENTGMFTADEMLYPSNFQYLIDILAYVAVGARSVENQEHRLVASGVSMPVGMKNPTGGSTTVLLNSIYAAQAPQTFIFRNWEVETTATRWRTPCCAATSAWTGATTPTTTTSTSSAWPSATPENFANPAVIVDCNHDNSGKRPLRAVPHLQRGARLLPPHRAHPWPGEGLHGGVLPEGRQPARGRRRVRQVHHGRLHRLGQDGVPHPRARRARLALPWRSLGGASRIARPMSANMDNTYVWFTFLSRRAAWSSSHTPSRTPWAFTLVR